MHSKLLRILTASALCVAASSCNSRAETHLAFPPVADLEVVPEPPYPVEALEPGPDGEAAERAWWNKELLWGRDHRDKVARICNWAKDLGYTVPIGWCG